MVAKDEVWAGKVGKVRRNNCRVSRESASKEGEGSRGRKGNEG